VWQLCDADASSSYVDVANTQDALGVFGGFALGGSSTLSLVRLDAAAMANRMELALPSPSTSGTQQRRRQHCSIKDLVGTPDGSHVLIVCSDGGVHLFEATGGSSAVGELRPLSGLSSFAEDDEVIFALCKVREEEGGQEELLLVRSWRSSADQCGHIRVEPLHSVIAHAERHQRKLDQQQQQQVHQRWHAWFPPSLCAPC
jgi:hypothetical protein